ncbi:DNA stabilization protein [Salmonella phage 40]|nr:DNA stabilization protein [Salmonella phage 40]
MKVKGTHTTTQSIEVDLADNEIEKILRSQTVEQLATVIQGKLKLDFLLGLEPKFSGSRSIRKSCKSGSGEKLALIHVDADWNYHNNVGEDKEVRLLTDDEEERYKILCNIARTIVELQNNLKAP